MRSERVDLHCHSRASDGVLPPEAVVARADEAGVRVLALTDHDTLAGLPPARRVAMARGLRLVAGLELSVTWARRTLHVVGLDVAEDCARLNSVIDDQASRRWDRAERIAAKLASAGVPGALEAAVVESVDGPPGRQHFARVLVDRGVVASPRQAFKRWLGLGGRAAVAVEWVSMDEGIDAILAAGGIPVLAHPTRYGFTRAWLRDAVRAFRGRGGQGIEVVTGGDGPGDRSSVAAMARREGLMASLGSDFHDPAFPWRALGRLAALPSDLVPVWSGRDWAPG